MGLQKLLHQRTSLNTFIAVSKEACCRSCEAEDKEVRANEVLDTDSEVLESILLTNNCQETKLLHAGYTPLAPFGKSTELCEQYSFLWLMLSALLSH